MSPVRLGTPAYSSYDPKTSTNRMIPLNDAPTPKDSGPDKAASPQDGADGPAVDEYDGMTPAELKELVEAYSLEMPEKGTGKGGSFKKADYIKVLRDAEAELGDDGTAGTDDSNSENDDTSGGVN